MKVKKSLEVNNNGAIEQQSDVKSQTPSVAESKQTNNGYAKTSTEPNKCARSTLRSSSPYPMVRSWFFGSTKWQNIKQLIIDLGKMGSSSKLVFVVWLGLGIS